jgi:5-methylthioadenosine/S-adenosylhomocysteine deaminase
VDGFSLTNCVVVSPEKIETKGCTVIDGRISEGNSPKKIDLKKASIVYPALINVHDHLKGNYLPRVGPSDDNFYINWSPWDNDLKASKTYEEREHLNDETKYFLSSYKNLFSGVVTVNDHFPHALNDKFIPNLPIRVIRDYALAHECSSFDLKWGEGIEIEHARAVTNGWPFITHLEEGFDAESQAGIELLEKLSCLDDHDLFIHCIGFSDEDIRRTKKAGASVSWCPASNIFMFNVTCKIRKILQAGINVSIGTDSTHTGSINLLEEMKFARATYRRLYGEDLDAKTITMMVTKNPAKAFWMEKEVGQIKNGFRGDILVLKAVKDDPYENLAEAGMEDIELLAMDGVPIYGESRFRGYFETETRGYGTVKVGGREMFVKGDPASLLKFVRDAVGFKKKLDYLPFEV